MYISNASHVHDHQQGVFSLQLFSPISGKDRTPGMNISADNAGMTAESVIVKLPLVKNYIIGTSLNLFSPLSFCKQKKDASSSVFEGLFSRFQETSDHTPFDLT